MNATALSAQQARTGMSFQHFPDYYRPYASLQNAWQLPDGSSLVMGATHGGSYQTVLYKLTPEGALDTRFAASGTVPGILLGLELTPGADRLLSDVEFADVGPDGSVWVLFNTANYSGPVLVRLSSDGSLDPSFNAEGPLPGTLDIELGTYAGVFSIDAFDDGSARVATLTRHEDDGGSRMELEVLRVDAAGQTTRELNLELGDVPGLSMENIFYLADGSTLVQAREYASSATVLARVAPQGQLDADFNSEGSPAGVLVVPFGDEWLILADGDLLQIDHPRWDHRELTLTRRNADGSVDAAFSASDALSVLQPDTYNNSATIEILQLDDGKFIVAVSGDVLGVRLLRLNADGSLDTGFNASGTTPGMAHIELDPRYVVDTLELQSSEDGGLTLTGSQSLFNFSVRLVADGTFDPAYGVLPDQAATSVNGDLLPAVSAGALIGGLGLDWADFEGTLAEHSVSVSFGHPWSDYAWTVEATDASMSVRTYGVERLRFDDLSLAIDTDMFYFWSWWGPQEQWNYAGNAAAIVAALWGPAALEDTRLVGEVLAYVDSLGAVSTLNQLMAAPEIFGMQALPSPEDWLQRMHVNLLGQEASSARLQHIIERTADLNLSRPTTLLQALAQEEPLFYSALRDLLLPFGDDQRGLVYREFEGLIVGTSQNDSFDSRAIDDQIDAGSGLDEVVYGRPANAATVERQEDGALRVQGPGDTVDLLWNVERLRFGDITLAFDLAEGQSANQAARVVTALAGSQALNDRWLMKDVVEHMDRLGFEAVTSLLVDSGIAAHYAGSTDIEALVATVYANLHGSASTPEDLQWHQDFVAQAGWSEVEVLRFAALHPLTAQRMDLAELAGQGLAYTAPYFDVFNIGGA